MVNEYCYVNNKPNWIRVDFDKMISKELIDSIYPSVMNAVIVTFMVQEKSEPSLNKDFSYTHACVLATLYTKYTM